MNHRACWVVIVLMLAASRLPAADETLLAAMAAKAWGIATYKVTVERGEGRHAVHAVLLNAQGREVGEFRRVKRAVDITDTQFQQRLETARLTWGGDQIEIETDPAAGTFHVTVNGQDLGVVTVRPDRQEASQQIAEFIRERSDLLQLIAAISLDLNKQISESVQQAR